MIELIGILLPPIIDFVNRKVTNEDVRLLISILICAIIGTMINYITSDGFHDYTTKIQYADEIGKSIMMTFGWAQLSFHGYWKKTDMHQDLR
jgi:hypothetical protein